MVNNINYTKLEHLTPQSDEAIQNLASLYNKDELTIGKLNVTGDANITGNVPTINSNIIKTNKLNLGDKWLFSGDGDAFANDDWLRLFKTDGSKTYHGGLAAGRLWTENGTINGRNLFTEIDALKTHVENVRPTCNWDGWRQFCGGCSDRRDDYNVHCEGGKLTHMFVQDARLGGGADARFQNYYDLTGSFKTNDINDCAQECKGRYGAAALCAQRRNDGQCWCKSFLGLTGNNDGNWQAKLLQPAPPPPPPLPPGQNPCVVM